MTIASDVKRDVSDRYAVRLVGHFGLWRPDGAEVTLRSRRARALLAYLILTVPQVASRERLAALLWSERSDDHARASLRQVLLELRGLTQEGLLSVSRSELGAISTALSTDLDHWALAAQNGDTAALIRLYGEQPAVLLDDLVDIDPLFDEWLATRREHHHEARRATALAACEEAIVRGDSRAALRLAHIVALADPLDEGAAVVAMRAAQALGDVAVVRRVFLALRAALDRDLGVSPSNATIAAFEEAIGDTASASSSHASPPDPQQGIVGTRVTVAVGGYRAAGNGVGEANAASPLDNRASDAAVLPSPAYVCEATDHPPVREGHPERGSWRRRGIAAGVVILLAGSMLAGLNWQRTVDDRTGGVVTVQPLTTKPDDVIAREIGAGLQAAIVRHLTGTGTPVQITDDDADGVSARLIIRGNSSADRRLLRANIELVAKPSQTVVWAGSFVRSIGELDQFEDQVSIQIARELHCAYGDGRKPFFDRDPEFARLSLSHCDTLGRNMDEAVRYDWQIVRLAPSFARGWSEYAMDTALVAEDMPPQLRNAGFSRATKLAQRALALDPHQGLAYAALVVASRARSWREREALVHRGLKADPTSPELHLRHAFMLITLGRQQDALGETMAAYHYDHLLPDKLINRALAEIAVGQLDRAQDDLTLGRTYWPTLPTLDDIVIALGIAGRQPEQALRVVQARVRRGADPADDALVAFLTWRAAQTGANELAAVKSIVSAARLGESLFEDVRLLALLRHFNDAFWLASNPGGTEFDPNLLNPELAQFQQDKRFAFMIKRSGLVAAWQQTGLWPDMCADTRNAAICGHATEFLSPRSSAH